MSKKTKILIYITMTLCFTVFMSSGCVSRFDNVEKDKTIHIYLPNGTIDSYDMRDVDIRHVYGNVLIKVKVRSEHVEYVNPIKIVIN